MSTSSMDGITAGPATNRSGIRLILFRVLAALAGLFFLVAVVLAVPAPLGAAPAGGSPRGGEPLVSHRG
jgi:preprotein translocase subunit SecG